MTSIPIALTIFLANKPQHRPLVLLPLHSFTRLRRRFWIDVRVLPGRRGRVATTDLVAGTRLRTRGRTRVPEYHGIARTNTQSWANLTTRVRTRTTCVYRGSCRCHQYNILLAIVVRGGLTQTCIFFPLS
jgi:hypothetical protein